MYKKIYTQTDQYYTSLIDKYGPNHQGIGWNSTDSQFLRYEQISKIIAEEQQEDNFVICDYGCGYGQLYEYLQSKIKDKGSLQYIGIDISNHMIQNAKELYGENNEQHSFIEIASIEDISEYDYIVSSGIFNIKQEIGYEEWTQYVLHNLEQFNKKSRKGFSFNCLTKYSDEWLMKDELYYGDPLFFFDYCKRHFSKNVALLHDYDLYEFTILVRK